MAICRPPTRLPTARSGRSAGSPEHRGNHEGYVSGYFIESAINHYTLTDGQDLRLYNAAKKLADCWVANHRPGQEGVVRRPSGDGAGAGALRPFRQRHGRQRTRRRLHQAREVPAGLAPRRTGVRPEPPAAGPAVRGRGPRCPRRLLLLRHGGHRRGDRRPATTRALCSRCGTTWSTRSIT